MLGMHPVAEVAEKVIGRRPSAATCHRWRSSGIKGIKLPCCYMLGQWHTSEESLTKFLQDTSQAMQTPKSERQQCIRDMIKELVAEVDYDIYKEMLVYTEKDDPEEYERHMARFEEIVNKYV